MRALLPLCCVSRLTWGLRAARDSSRSSLWTPRTRLLTHSPNPWHKMTFNVIVASCVASDLHKQPKWGSVMYQSTLVLISGTYLEHIFRHSDECAIENIFWHSNELAIAQSSHAQSFFDHVSSNKGVDYMPPEWICIISFYGWSSYVISFGLRQYLDFVPYIIERVPKYLGWRGNTFFFQTRDFL